MRPARHDIAVAGRSLALLGAALLAAMTMSACDTTRRAASSLSPAHRGASGGYLRDDGDSDNDDERHPAKVENDDRELFATYGRPAGPADAGAIAALVKSYYRASTGGDGARACSLLYGTLASGLATQASSSVSGAHDTCSTNMSVLLRQQHQRLIAENPATMLVTAVRVRGSIGLAVLGFRKMPESQMLVEREGARWKIDALFDSLVP
jgi:hypothetical protein